VMTEAGRESPGCCCRCVIEYRFRSQVLVVFEVSMYGIRKLEESAGPSLGS
jgi:hypothetical protein